MSGSLLPPVLNPNTLYGQEAKRDATRIRIYNNVLTQIYTKVKAVARIPGNEKALWYLVPEFIPGTPRFDIADCVLYLVWNLRNAGYKVEYTHPNLMYIDWRHHDARYREQESPWAQVLGAAREQVLSDVPTSKPMFGSLRPATAPAQQKPAESYISETKRKSVLKKTMEYKPTMPDTKGPSVPAVTSVVGALTPRHVSFV
jgi:hypothetical protein